SMTPTSDPTCATECVSSNSAPDPTPGPRTRAPAISAKTGPRGTGGDIKRLSNRGALPPDAPSAAKGMLGVQPVRRLNADRHFDAHDAALGRVVVAGRARAGGVR
ncbi:MAG TPA: hypothetical protein VEK07_14705, partial [Polyangiaceae bacterium]|nr:hypothetical protein [Polyangiaceae bacterium]